MNAEELIGFLEDNSRMQGVSYPFGPLIAEILCYYGDFEYLPGSFQSLESLRWACRSCEYCINEPIEYIGDVIRKIQYHINIIGFCGDDVTVMFGKKYTEYNSIYYDIDKTPGPLFGVDNNGTNVDLYRNTTRALAPTPGNKAIDFFISIEDKIQDLYSSSIYCKFCGKYFAGVIHNLNNKLDDIFITDHIMDHIKSFPKDCRNVPIAACNNVHCNNEKCMEIFARRGKC